MRFTLFNKSNIKLALSFFWAFPVLIIWRYTFFLHKYYLIKIRSDRIGHFVSDGAEQIARKYLKKNKKAIYCYDHIISNNQWAKMLKKKLTIYTNLIFVVDWSKKIYNNQKFILNGTETNSRDIFNLYDKTNVRLDFTESENQKGLLWLNDFGFKIGDKFICLIVRNNDYLNKNFKEKDWKYSDFRNSDIQKYKKGIEWLISKNYWVIRMGNANSKRLDIESDKFIDYSFTKNKSDLIDIWLFANCNGCITTGTGPDAISHVHNIPCLGVNWLPLMDIHSFQNIITYPKYLYHDQRLLSIDEYINHSYTKTLDYEKRELIIKDLSSLQILKAFKEFYFYKLENKKISENFKIKNERFWHEILKKDPNNLFHKEIHKKALISEEWINAHV